MKKEDIDKLFGPFNPLPNTKSKVIEPIAFTIIVSVIIILIIESEEEPK